MKSAEEIKLNNRKVKAQRRLAPLSDEFHDSNITG